MKKKILYGIFFLSLFLLSTASMARPVQGYEFAVTKEAKGYKFEGEIKIYDEDEWDDHLGKQSTPKNYKDGDVDVVGAKSKGKIIDIESNVDDLDYIDRVMLGDRTYAWDGNAMIMNEIDALVDYYKTSSFGFGALVALLSDTMAYEAYVVSNGLNYSLNSMAYQFNLTKTKFSENIMSAQEALALWGKKYDGSKVTYDFWNAKEGGDFNPNPDINNDEYDYFADPRDWKEASYEAAMNFKLAQQADIDELRVAWQECSELFYYGGVPTTTNPAGSNITYSWEYYFTGDLYANPYGLETYLRLNQSIYLYWVDFFLNPSTYPYIYDLDTFNYLVDTLGSPNDALLRFYGAPSWAKWGSNYSYDFVSGIFGAVDILLYYLWLTLEYGYLDKGGMLLSLFENGLSCYVPQDDYLAKVIDDFDLDEDTLYRVTGVQKRYDLDGDGWISVIPLGTTRVGRLLPYETDPDASYPFKWRRPQYETRKDSYYYDMSGETVYAYAYIDASVEDSVVTLEIEYQDGQVDPWDPLMDAAGLRKDSDPYDELEDFEWVFEYSDYGSQSSQYLKDGDDIFWQTGGGEQFPVIQLSIILGASALAILALIYIVMKKRRK